MDRPIHILLHCPDDFLPRARYVFDTLFMARRTPVKYVDHVDQTNTPVHIVYGGCSSPGEDSPGCLRIFHSPEACSFLKGNSDAESCGSAGGLPAVFTETADGAAGTNTIPFDLVANAFYFLSSWSEQQAPGDPGRAGRALFKDSVFHRLKIPQNIVDEYLALLVEKVDAVLAAAGHEPLPQPEWPGDSRFAIVLSHDVDFIPSGIGDVLVMGIRTLLRHCIRHRDPSDAIRAGRALIANMARGRNPYLCVPDMVRREKDMGVRASYQVAVGHRHPEDVNYRIEDERVRDYLRNILDEGFDLCLHGSYLSTEQREWYVEEAKLLGEHLRSPLGSRQHFLSFNFPGLFSAQEEAGIEYDMSVGYPDQAGFRSGFSHPYFPFNLKENRPYRVLEISLFLMDVTLRSHLGLKGDAAYEHMVGRLDAVERTGGCGSIVWHPVLFASARDPGFDRLFWKIVEHVGQRKGLAAAGDEINTYYRGIAGNYTSFK